MTLPPDIQEVFFNTLTGDKTILEFEDWLYADTRLESILDVDDYLELVSYGYKEANANKGLFRLLEKHIDKAEFEKRRMLRMLTKALNRDKELPEILMSFYDLYCKGYYFLDNLGLRYGIDVETAWVKNASADSWKELTEKQQADLLNGFYPALEIELDKIISWIVHGKVILTGIKGEYDHFEYIDNRTELEKEPTSYKVIRYNKK